MGRFFQKLKGMFTFGTAKNKAFVSTLLQEKSRQLKAKVFEEVEKKFLLRGFAVSGIHDQKWEVTGSIDLITEYFPTKLGRFLHLPEKAPDIKTVPLRTFSVTIMIEGVYGLCVSMPERNVLNIGGEDRWGLFYRKKADVILRPSEFRFEIQMWEAILDEAVKLRDQIEQVKAQAREEAKVKEFQEYKERQKK